MKFVLLQNKSTFLRIRKSRNFNAGQFGSEETGLHFPLRRLPYEVNKKHGIIPFITHTGSTSQRKKLILAD